jgi:hypothetical protein
MIGSGFGFVGFGFVWFRLWLEFVGFGLWLEFVVLLGFCVF